MGTWQWLLDLVVAGLLAATLLRARRLERALTILRQDRGALEAMLGNFDASAKQARGGVERLRELTESAGRRIEHQTAAAVGVQDELAGLIERGEKLAEQLDHAVRAVRAASGPAERERAAAARPASRAALFQTPPADAYRRLAAGALSGAVAPLHEARPGLPRAASLGVMDSATGEPGRVRSKAERDLLQALQGR